MSKDPELGRAGYDSFASPKPGADSSKDEAEDRPLRGASIPRLMLISLPRMAIAMTWSAQWAALGPYLGTMMPRYAVQLTQVIGPLSGILVGPTVGVFSDRSTNKWGRRRPFLAIASVLSAICWTLMGFTREIGTALGDVGSGQKGEVTHRPWTIFFAVFFYAWMDITVNVVQTPMFLLISDFAGERQTLGASIGQGWSKIGQIMVSGYIYIFGAAHKSLKSFLAMLSITMLVTVAISCAAARETPRVSDKTEKVGPWRQIKNVFVSIFRAIKTLPSVLIVYALVFFFVEYGFVSYNGNKGQFFGIEVYGGEATGASTCGKAGKTPCTEAQENYNHGVKVAGGSTDLMFNIVSYLFTWMLPFLVKKFGAKRVLIASLVPQSLLLVMAFSRIVTLNVIIVVITSLSRTTVFALLVPVIVHVFGDKGEIGVYVGALNSSNNLGQLLNFSIGSALVETSLGYQLPVFVGGGMSLIGVIVGALFLKLKMYTM